MPEDKITDIMGRFREIVDKPYEKLRQWKEANQKKVVGCSSMQLPEEMIHAAGMLPAVLQETDEIVSTGFSHVYPFYCGITRNIIDIAVKGQLGFFDGLVYSDICIHNRHAACTLKQIMSAGYVKYVQLPTSLTRDGVMEDTVKELEKIKAGLEQLSEHKIDDTSLKQSIVVYNKNRSLLRQLHEMRKGNPMLLPYRDMQAIVQSSMLMPKEEHTELLEKLLAEMEGMKPASVKGSRLFLSGHFCQSPKADILDLIEWAGGIIVDNDLYTGYRYYAVDVAVNGNPIDALAKRYLEKSLPVPTRSYPPVRWENYIVERVKDSEAQGVIVLVVKFCEPHLFSYPFIQDALAKAGIPHIMLETEHEVVSLEGARTRLQAFVEMLN
jgi:benzoyl-CoA reductase subunit C